MPGGVRMDIRELLVGRRDEILSRFVDRVAELHAPVAIRRSLILDGLPEFLDDAVRHIGAVPPPEVPEPSGPPSSSASDHGAQRFEMGVDIVTVEREWGVLRDVIFEVLIEQREATSIAEFQSMSRAISHAATAALTRYVELAESARRKLAADHVGFVVHDLRNQVQGASVALDLLQRRPDDKPVALECLADSLFGLMRVLDRELSRARIEALHGGLPPAFEDLSVKELVARVTREVRPLAISRGVEVTADVAPLLEVRGDGRLLHSALANLIGNAIKFTHTGTAVNVTARAADGGVQIEISDHCGGLSAEHRERIFTAHVHGSQERSGFGLGLAIARQAIELHGGGLEVSDRPGVGCSFRVVVPAAATPP
jgi:signal transduction histidine kinase